MAEDLNQLRRMADRRRVAAAIVRNGCVLMVRERNRGPGGRHDGVEFWTLPGGGVEPGESEEDAVAREVREEVGLQVARSRRLYDFAYPSGHTTVYEVEVEPGEPMLGVDPDMDCDCPRMVGLDWVPAPPMTGETGGLAIPTVIAASDIPREPADPPVRVHAWSRWRPSR